MKFFLDTANVDDVRELAKTGLIDGITTNPSLVLKSAQPFEKVIAEMCELVQGPVSAEVIATDAESMILEGHKLTKISPNVTIKVPLTMEGLKACHVLSNEGIMVNVTLCFSAAQALLAAKAGATFISPFVGRLDDCGHDGMELLSEIKMIYDNYPHFDTEILAASIRHPLHVVQAAKIGADICTIPPSIMHQLFKHPLTDKGLESFLKDWEKTGQKI